MNKLNICLRPLVTTGDQTGDLSALNICQTYGMWAKSGPLGCLITNTKYLKQR